VYIGINTDRIIRCWFCLEVNILTFLGILVSAGIKRNKSVVVYFRFQTIPSLIIFLSIVLQFILPLNIKWLIFIMVLSKLGAAPFQSWYVMVAYQLSPILFLWLVVIQKLIPFQIIYILIFKEIVLSVVFISIFIRTRFIIIQTNFKKVLIGSSIFSNNWVLRAINLEGIEWKHYFVCYRRFISIFIWRTSIKIESNNFILCEQSLINLKIHILYRLILRGFPPGPIFIIKLIIVKHLVQERFIWLGIFLIIRSAITLLAFCNLLYLKILRERCYWWKFPDSKGYNKNSFCIKVSIIICGYWFPYEIFS